MKKTIYKDEIIMYNVKYIQNICKCGLKQVYELVSVDDIFPIGYIKHDFQIMLGNHKDKLKILED